MLVSLGWNLGVGIAGCNLGCGLWVDSNGCVRVDGDASCRVGVCPLVEWPGVMVGWMFFAAMAKGVWSLCGGLRVACGLVCGMKRLVGGEFGRTRDGECTC